MQANFDWLNWPEVAQLFTCFDTHELRFVGGCVRDSLLGRSVRDLDAATTATPEQIIALLEAANIRALPTGLAHGTVTALFTNRQIEITTLREDIKPDGRHSAIRFTNDWRTDAARRDFTMNAIFCDQAGHLYDYTDGLRDAKAGRVRFIGDATKRIREDYLRILRFFRFYATHGQGEADAAALAACTAEKHGLASLSGERIQQEMQKLLASDSPLAALAAMQQARIDEPLWPAGEWGIDALARLLAIKHPLARSVWLRLAVYCYGHAVVKAKAIAERWRLSNQDARLLNFLLHTPPIDESLTSLALAEGKERAILLHWRDVACVGRPAMDDEVVALEQQALPEFPINGHDMAAYGLSGKALGEVLQRLRSYWQAQDGKPDKEALLARLNHQ